MKKDFFVTVSSTENTKLYYTAVFLNKPLTASEKAAVILYFSYSTNPTRRPKQTVC